jgi:glycosyltransferase involved in cell wall biosynthesis
MTDNWFAALPVYNEANYVDDVLDEVVAYAPNVVAVNDGSTDGTREILDRRSDIHVLHHATNRGYGASLRTVFEYAIEQNYEYVVTLDCDGQHQPVRIPRFVAACEDVDIVSGSRYLKQYEGDSAPPADRLFVNRQITKRINDLFSWNLTDTFCGFKAYRVSALEKLDITETGYAMPLELWVQAAMKGLSILEIPVPLIYLDESRSFGGSLDNSAVRLAHYNEVIDRSIEVMRASGFTLPTGQMSYCHEC